MTKSKKTVSPFDQVKQAATAANAKNTIDGGDVANNIGAVAVAVERFYKGYGFLRFPDGSVRVSLNGGFIATVPADSEQTPEEFVDERIT